jgi:hypothetical protein
MERNRNGAGAGNSDLYADTYRHARILLVAHTFPDAFTDSALYA